MALPSCLTAKFEEARKGFEECTAAVVRKPRFFTLSEDSAFAVNEKVSQKRERRCNEETSSGPGPTKPPGCAVGGAVDVGTSEAVI